MLFILTEARKKQFWRRGFFRSGVRISQAEEQHISLLCKIPEARLLRRLQQIQKQRTHLHWKILCCTALFLQSNLNSFVPSQIELGSRKNDDTKKRSWWVMCLQRQNICLPKDEMFFSLIHVTSIWSASSTPKSPPSHGREREERIVHWQDCMKCWREKLESSTGGVQAAGWQSSREGVSLERWQCTDVEGGMPA